MMLLSNNKIRLLKIVCIIYIFYILYIFNSICDKIEHFSNNNIPIYVVSLVRATDRREYIDKLLKDTYFTYFNAIDGKDIQQHDMYLIKEYVHSDYEKK